MFSDKEFYLVNREERHFGFMLISSIVYDKEFREYFFNLINHRLYTADFVNPEVGVPKILNNEDYDIYSEVALFRDYWNDLGDHNKYTQELHFKRKCIIEIFLECFGLDKSLVDKYSMFWTGKVGESKLWFPGKWSIGSINLLQSEEAIKNREILRIRWACNAKPDLLILSKNSGILIELKVESGIGEGDLGYNQEETQIDIMNLAKATIPIFKNIEFKRLMLEKKRNSVLSIEGLKNKLTWDEIMPKFNNELVKKHMLNMPK